MVTARQTTTTAIHESPQSVKPTAPARALAPPSQGELLGLMNDTLFFLVCLFTPRVIRYAEVPPRELSPVFFFFFGKVLYIGLGVFNIR
jgi:hypothetical protein